MLANDELQHILESQPYLRMRTFAELLGWRGLQMFKCRDEQVPGGLLVYYMTGDERFNLQINGLDPYGASRFQACVKAARYRIIHTEWQPFELFIDDRQMVAEAERLYPFLARGNFKDREWRKRFAEEFPQRIYPIHGNWKRK